jgi:predicted nucleic acid-binding protein
MSVNYDIQSEVIDIRNDSPRSNDKFFVDTNVWFWTTYQRATQSPSPPSPYQTSDYPQYLDKALGINAQILRFGLSFAELANLIESTEYEIIYKPPLCLNRKEFRHNNRSYRGSVINEVESAWSQVIGMSSAIDLTIDDPKTDSALKFFKKHPIGGYDLFILEAMKENKLVQIITDDGDFACVPDIQVFTANRNVIQSAKSQGKLVKR